MSCVGPIKTFAGHVMSRRKFPAPAEVTKVFKLLYRCTPPGAPYPLILLFLEVYIKCWGNPKAEISDLKSEK